jgi:N-methylhydantoinase A
VILPHIRIGIDVGGTFTDFVLVDRATGRLGYHKEPSVPSDPSAAVENGLKGLISAQGIDPAAIELVVHGTTIGLNATIQRRGARMAMVVSRGNRDVLEIARLRLPSSYDFTAPREAPLVPRDLMFELGARQRADGRIETDPDPDEIKALAQKLRTSGVEAVAIMLLNSYRNPDMEIAVADALRAELPGVLITESAVVWPEVREYERALVAGLNASIHPLMTRYFDRLLSRVKGLGIAAPIYITANNGGTLSLETARARPIDTVLSGPASGVVAACRVGEAAGQPRLVTIDMGGTSADISIVQSGTPEFTTATFVGDFPLMMPVVNVGAIGAGGGSILWVDAQGVLKVGPLSAGADPGPVAYGRGGKDPTVTDCYLVLGIVDPDRFLGGRMRLDLSAARQALDKIAERIGLSGPDRAEAAAEAALRVASAKMATELTKLLATAGVDPRRFSLVAFGGAGPTHANLLAEEAGLTSVLVPTAPGTFCALGAILADVRRDYVRTARQLVGAGADQSGFELISTMLKSLVAEASEWIAQEGAIVGAHDFVVTMRMRYPGQAYELDVAIPDAAITSGLALAELFHAEHHRLYGFAEHASGVQVTTLRVGVIGRVPPVMLPDQPPTKPVARSSRKVRHAGAFHIADVYDRDSLGQGALVYGPAIVEQLDTTSFVLPGWQAHSDRIGTLHLTKVAS